MPDYPFSLDAWNTHVLLLQTHELRTRDGRSVRIVCTNRGTTSDIPIVALVQSESNVVEQIQSYKANGTVGINGSSLDLTIVPIPPVSLGWVVVFKSTTQGGVTHAKLFDTEEDAKAIALTYTHEHSFQQVVSITEIFQNI